MKYYGIKDYTPDVVLIGGGIMSATLGMMIHLLDPDLTIEIFERLEQVAEESSGAWNNAGTGHSAYCELNYTPEKEGIIDVEKAIKIAEQFEVSKQFWASLVIQQILNPSGFIHTVPHHSIVFDEPGVAFLKKRYEALIQHPLFEAMQFSSDSNELKTWIPLIMHQRLPSEHVAATRMDAGTDVNFESLTKQLFEYLKQQENISLNLHHEVRDLDEDGDGKWFVSIKDLATGERKSLTAGKVFIGAGGRALTLLEKADVKEADGYGGFPVSGEWLVCHNPELIEQHDAKVYGQAQVGAPPMSVPHLDTRFINGKKELLFGPFAGFSTKFLKKGSYLDLPASITFDNVRPMLQAGLHNIPLTKYLITQVLQSREDRMNALRQFVPNARDEDWGLKIAGQRVQVIKDDVKEGGILEFGTEIITSANGSVAALLGASPGASTAVSIMLGVLHKMFPQKMGSPVWLQKLKQLIPSLGEQLNENAALCNATRKRSHEILGLQG